MDSYQQAYIAENTILSSVWKDGIFHKSHTPWQLMYHQFMPDGTLILLRDSFFSNKKKEYYRLNISNLQLMKIELDSYEYEGFNKYIAVKMQARDRYNIEAAIRIVFASESEFTKYLNAITSCSTVNNIDAFTSTLVDTSRVDDSHKTKKKSLFKISMMKKSISRVINKVEKRSRVEIIKSRRGAFCWLPTFFNNDLVHGSWWFVLGSLLTTLCAAVVIANKYEVFLGTDDSVLSYDSYVTTWFLILFSGLFYTIGSAAFVRAMSEPPMKPMFKWHHISTDELFASWMFFMGTFLLLPYVLVFLVEEGNKLIIFMVFLLVILIFCQYIWVTTCYPSEEGQEERQAMFLRFMDGFCCGPKSNNCLIRGIRRHFATDWLSGCWLLFWITFWGTVFFIMYSVYEYYFRPHRNGVTPFINATTVIECVMFLIGAAYFVAGSYPSILINEVSTSDRPGTVPQLESTLDGDPLVHSPRGGGGGGGRGGSNKVSANTTTTTTSTTQQPQDTTIEMSQTTVSPIAQV